MSGKLSADAFAYYVGLGAERSYQAVAEHFEVSKRTVTRTALREDWQDRLQGIESDAREGADRKMAESLEGMNARHLKTLRFIQGKALEALKTMPLTAAMDAVRALDVSIGKERLIRGEPSDRTAVSVEQVIEREYQRWMAREGDDDHDDQSEA